MPVLAELFTSEGCSGCPPADQLLQKLDQLQPVAGAQIIVLSEHVDYWDQLGWRDPFSSHQFTQRQQAYSRAVGARCTRPNSWSMDGKRWSAMTWMLSVARLPGLRPGRSSRFALRRAKRDGAEAAVTVSIGPLAKGKAEVWIAVADEADRSSVSRGENSGHTLTHVAVVRSLTRAGTVTKSEGMEKTVRLPGGRRSRRGWSSF